jgi:trehalose synthase
LRLDASRRWRTAKWARALLQGRAIWNVNSTARGGGVVEMLQSLLGYVRGAGLNARWVVIGAALVSFA